MMEFRHNKRLSRYEAWLDGELAGEAHYRLSGEVADFDHTQVAQQFAGRGIAGELVHYAMDDLRAGGELKVRPSCSYVVAWFARRPEYADLLASSLPGAVPSTGSGT